MCHEKSDIRKYSQSLAAGIYVGSEEMKDREVQGIVTDSRKAEPGFLFVPIKGARVDAHDFIDSVMANGALCTLTEKDIGKKSFPYIKVHSSLQAVKDIAEFYLKQLDIPVVGITGSVGKTSTKEMIAAVLEQKYKVLKTKGNFNNELGVPLTVFGLRPEHEIAVLEMGISDFGEMHRLAKIARPDTCVITNIRPVPSGVSEIQRRHPESQDRDLRLPGAGWSCCPEWG